MGAVVSSSHIGSAAPSSSPSSPALAWGPSHVRESSTNCSSLSPSHRLQFFTNCSRVDLLQGAVPQEQPAPAWIPHGVTSPASKPAPARAPLSTAPQILPGACSSTGLPPGPSLHPSGIPLLQHGVLPSCGWGSAPSWASMAAGTACITTVCTMVAEEPLLWHLEHLLPSFCTDCGVCMAVSHTFSFLSPAAIAITQGFFFLSTMLSQRCYHHR